MKTWFDWMDCYYEPAVHEISDVEETERLKKRVMDLLHEEGCVKPTRRRFQKAVLAAVAAAIVCCAGAGALAATDFPWDSVFGSYFGSDAPKQAMELGMPGKGLELNATDARCTLTLKGALFDGEELYLPLTISLEQEAINPDWNYYAMGTADGSDNGGSVMLTDQNGNDNAVDLMCTLSGHELESGRSITWNVFYLYATCSDEAGNTEVVWEKEGHWNFAFVIPEAQQTLEWSVPEDTTDPVTGILLKQVRLTAMRAIFVFDGLPEDSNVRNALSEAQIVLHFADGSDLMLADWDKGMRDAHGSADANASPIGRAFYEVSCEYGNILDPTQIIAIEFNGRSISPL